MAKGSAPGERRGGRQKGTPNRASAAKAAEVAASGLTPLEWMLQVLRDPAVDYDRRDKMAVAAAPFVHPKLAAVEHSGKDGGPIEVEASSNNRQLARAILVALGSAAVEVTD